MKQAEASIIKARPKSEKLTSYCQMPAQSVDSLHAQGKMQNVEGQSQTNGGVGAHMQHRESVAQRPRLHSPHLGLALNLDPPCGSHTSLGTIA